MILDTTAVLAIGVVLGLALAIIVTLMLQARSSAARAAEQTIALRQTVETDATDNRDRLTEIHKLVDGRLSTALEQIDHLEDLLQTATGRVPTGEPDPGVHEPQGRGSERAP
jgi:hypothetical protein